VTEERAQVELMGTKDVTISLNPQQAMELYDYLEDDNSPPYWETALAPIHEALRDAHRRGEW